MSRIHHGFFSWLIFFIIYLVVENPEDVGGGRCCDPDEDVEA
jgi:hypothetical protein